MTTKFLTPEPPKDDGELESIIEFYRVSFDFHVDQADKLASENETLAQLHARSASDAQRKSGQERRDDWGGVLWVN